MLTPIINSTSKKVKTPFIAKIELFSSKTVDSFSNILKILFNTKVVFTIILLIVLAEVLFFVNSNTSFDVGQMDMYTILGVLMLFIVSSCAHELGHASACRYYGVSHGGIGVGLYLSFPVFYTDVTNTWRLKRKQRLVVNIAGIYFQLIFLLPLITIYLFTGNEILKYFIFTVNINFLVTLNPFFKFDGYWIISDLLGVTNLRERTNELFKYLASKIKRGKDAPTPFILTLTPIKKYPMIIYSLVVNLFFVYVFAYLIPKFIYNYITVIPKDMKLLIEYFMAGQVPPFSLLHSIFVPTIFLFFFLYMIVKILKPVWTKMRHKL